MEKFQEHDSVIESVPYIAYEGTQARNERTINRLFIIIIVSIILSFASNAAWLYYESQFKTISYEQDGEGLNNINAGSQGDIDYGAESADKDKQESKAKSDQD